MERLKIVITGASGFIGQHLVENFKDNPGVDVVAVSRREFKNSYMVLDYTETPVGDVLIHLAEDNNTESVAAKGEAYEKTTLSTLDSLLSKRYKRIVYVSTSVLYGDYTRCPHKTSDEIQSDSPYKRIKVLSEQAVLGRSNGFVVRLGNVYGPLMSEKNVLSKILNQIPGDGNLVVNDSSPIRDFIWINDVANGIMAVALSEIFETEINHIFNIGTSIGTSIGDLAQLALEIAGQPERRVVSKVHSENRSSIILNYDETTRACGWVPQTSLREGICILLNSNLEAAK